MQLILLFLGLYWLSEIIPKIPLGHLFCCVDAHSNLCDSAYVHALLCNLPYAAVFGPSVLRYLSEKITASPIPDDSATSVCVYARLHVPLPCSSLPRRMQWTPCLCCGLLRSHFPLRVCCLCYSLPLYCSLFALLHHLQLPCPSPSHLLHFSISPFL